MTELTTEERLLNGFLRVILDAELNAAARQEAAMSLRSGRLVGCLLAVLEFSDEKRAESEASFVPMDVDATLPKDIEPPKIKAIKAGNSKMKTPDELFNLVRKRKVSKMNLMDFIKRLNSGSLLNVHDDASMREIIRTFKEVSSDAEWITLTRAVSGEIVSDPYLNRMLGR